MTLMGLITLISVSKAFDIQQNYVIGKLEGEKRIIKCQIPLAEDMIQNLYYVTESKQKAKELLFNSEKGLYFDNALYVKTQDFKGVNHVVAFSDVTCDAVGTQVSL